MSCPSHASLGRIGAPGCPDCFPRSQWDVSQRITGLSINGVPVQGEGRLTVPHIAADSDFAAVIAECDRVLATKGRDYTQGEGRLKNFYRNGERLGIPARQVLGIYLNKHLDAIETFIKRGQVESEPIEGRIVDAVNYLLLLAKMVREEGRAETYKDPHPAQVQR